MERRKANTTSSTKHTVQKDSTSTLSTMMTPEELVNSGDAKERSPLAVTYVDGVTHLCYVDNDDQVRFLTNRDGQWGSSSLVDNAYPHPSSQLTVVTDPEQSLNHLFFYPKDGKSRNQFNACLSSSQLIHRPKIPS
ncbi:hypothetical protein B0H67DRAFT_554884 [Lasiosphaeris hirsuta]|uniref:Fucose-specific lectin n=1 Tax=Lasiosphaeris hirsuta TaxID=260670 RepID=A0AA40DRP6_9PEZI|nr:hypothetical protein B0H67DRAFT_554884 [Lasiosphaeris hirsuta]